MTTTNIITVADITLSNGRSGERVRTIMSETGLAPTTAIEFVGTQSRWTGTGYKNSLYRIVGTDDLLIIRHNDGVPDNLTRDNVELRPGYFSAQRQYGAECRKASRRTGLPMEVCLAVSPELCEEFATLAGQVRRVPGGRVGSNATGFAEVQPYRLDDGAIGELYAGIGRRKNAIEALIPDMSEDLYRKVSGMGQKNSTRIAEYLASR